MGLDYNALHTSNVIFTRILLSFGTVNSTLIHCLAICSTKISVFYFLNQSRNRVDEVRTSNYGAPAFVLVKHNKNRDDKFVFFSKIQTLFVKFKFVFEFVVTAHTIIMAIHNRHMRQYHAQAGCCHLPSIVITGV